MNGIVPKNRKLGPKLLSYRKSIRLYLIQTIHNIPIPKRIR